MTTLFSQLRTFCSTLEQDSLKIRKVVSSDKHGEASTQATDEFVENLCCRVEMIENQLVSIDEAIFGPVDSRLTKVSTNEMYEKCLALFMANQNMIETIEKKAGLEVDSNRAALDKENTATLNSVPKLDDSKRPRVTFPTQQLQQQPQQQRPQHIQDEPSQVAAPVMQSEAPFSPAPWIERDESLELLAANGTPMQAPTDSYPDPDEYSSPSTSTLNVLEHSTEVGPQTPVLAAWKLSDATRSLFGQSGTLPASLMLPQQQQQHTGSKLNSHNKANRVARTSILEDSEADPRQVRSARGLRHQQHQTPATPATPKSPPAISVTAGGISNAANQGMHTPIAAGYVKSIPMDATPKTPTMGTPFRSNALRQLLEQGQDDDSESVSTDESPSLHNINYSSSAAAVSVHIIGEEFEVVGALDESPAATAPSSGAFLDDSILDEPLLDIMESPPKFQILVNPRDRPATVAPAKAAIQRKQISALQTSDWASAPVFLRQQVTVEVLNQAIAKINQFLLSPAADQCTNGMTTQQLEGVLEPAGIPVKPTLLALMQMKKLDIGSERGVKLYKVKMEV